MSRLNLIGWILIGVVIGALASTALTAANARQEPASRRLLVLAAGPLQTFSTSFIKDTKTGACWLAVRSRDDVSAALAPAPAASCEP
jgi:hypothetical protein